MKKENLKRLIYILKLSLAQILLIVLLSNLAFASEIKGQKAINVFEFNLELIAQNKSISEIFREIESKTDFRFAWDQELVKGKPTISIHENTIGDALKAISLQAKLNFRQVNEVIAVTEPRPNQNIAPIEVVINSKRLDGQVIDLKSGQPLVGATVMVKGTNLGAVTNVEGKFSISVGDDAVFLVISFIGYETKEVAIGDQAYFDIQLAEDISTLSEIVVVAYGVQSRSDITGAISSTDSEEFNKGVVTNPGQLLQGKVAGVNITSASGEPGAAQDVIIRGVGSLRSGTTPLYVVDGFVLDNSSTGVATNPLNFINSTDIESIEVLKDASATALYGARGSNGVVVITTKKGKKGDSEINLSVSNAWSSIANKMNVFSADEFRKQVPAAGGTLDDLGSDTDWQDELSRTAISKNVNLSMRGATDKFGYYASLGYQDQEGILKNSNLERFSGKLNVNQSAFDGKLKVAYNLTTTHIENLRPDQGALVTDMLQLNPTIPVYSDGKPTLLDNMLNPITRYDIYSDLATNNRILAGITPSIEIISGLTYKLNMGFDYSSTTRDIQNLPYALLEDYTNGTLQTAIVQNSNELIENTLMYKFNLGSHSTTILGGQSYQKFSRFSRSINTEGYADNGIEPKYQDFVASADLQTTISSAAEKNELQSFFGRLDYSYASRYLLTATFRADGSSKFGDNNKYGYFPSVALGWNITEEAFFSSSIIDYLKLRISWGQTGNQEVPAKQTQLSYTESKDNNDTYPLDENATTLDGYPYGTIFSRLPNKDLQWEVSTQTNLGLDFNLFDFRLTGNLDYYQKVSDNILLEFVPADPINEVSSIWANIPAMNIKNSGFELSLDYKSSASKQFSYNIGGNFSTLNNKVVNSPFAVLTTGAAQGGGQTGATINGYINNYPIGSFYMLEFEGIGEDGLNQFVDHVEDGAILENDRKVVGSALPNLLYAFHINMDYKGFALGLNFNGVSGNKIYNHTAMSIFTKGKLASNFNTTPFASEFPTEDITNSNTVSTRYLEDGDYVRLNNASLSYTLKPGLLGLENTIKNIRLSLTGQNLFVITNYSGFDPEVNTGTPSGDILTYGIDRFTYPSARTILVGLDVTF